MMGKTHRAFGVAMASTTLLTLYPYLSLYNSNDIPTAGKQVVLTLSAAWLTATVPDIDKHFKTHRGLTHAIWFPIILLIATWYATDINIYLSAFLFGTFIGYLSHLVGDAFSKAGIAWFYPLQRYRHYGSGAFVVKGNRGPFLPMYSVGKSSLVNPLFFWYAVAWLGFFFLWTRL